VGGERVGNARVFTVVGGRAGVGVKARAGEKDWNPEGGGLS
jgi:hypothetical protein